MQDRTTDILRTLVLNFPDLTGEEAQNVAEILSDWSDVYAQADTGAVNQTGNIWLSNAD